MQNMFKQRAQQLRHELNQLRNNVDINRGIATFIFFNNDKYYR